MRIKQFIKNSIFFCLNIFFGHLGDRASILMYHSVGDNPAFFTVTKNDFECQVDYLKRKNFKVVKLSELIKKIKNNESIRGVVCLTFDDGYKDNYEIVYPILKKYLFPATIFTATGFMGGEMVSDQNVSIDILSGDEILEMSKSGLIEFMPHTESHRTLDKISFGEGCTEIARSRETLEKITNTTADIFAYPKGKRTEEVETYLKKNNWEGAVLVSEGLVKSDKDCDVFKLKRNSIDSKTSFTQFKGKLGMSVEIFNRFKF